jgi:hypothetical protein
VFELLQGLMEFIKIIREDPRIGLALAILLLAGALVSILIGRLRRDEPISIRDIRTDVHPLRARAPRS